MLLTDLETLTKEIIFPQMYRGADFSQFNNYI